MDVIINDEYMEFNDPYPRSKVWTDVAVMLKPIADYLAFSNKVRVKDGFEPIQDYIYLQEKLLSLIDTVKILAKK